MTKQIEDNKGELERFESFGLETFFRFYASSLGDKAASKLYELTMKDIEILLKKAIDRALEMVEMENWTEISQELPLTKKVIMNEIRSDLFREFGINTGGEK